MNAWIIGDIIVHVPSGDADMLVGVTASGDGWRLHSGGTLPHATAAEGDWVLVSEMHANYRNVSAILEATSVRDLEMKIRDGVVNVYAVFGNDDETGTPSMRFLAAIMLNFLLGDANELPANYRTIEYTLTTAGERPMRMTGEVIHAGGRSAHELRIDLEQICDKFAAGDPSAGAAYQAYRTSRTAAR